MRFACLEMLAHFNFESINYVGLDNVADAEGFRKSASFCETGNALLSLQALPGDSPP